MCWKTLRKKQIKQISLVKFIFTKKCVKKVLILNKLKRLLLARPIPTLPTWPGSTRPARKAVSALWTSRCCPTCPARYLAITEFFGKDTASPFAAFSSLTATENFATSQSTIYKSGGHRKKPSGLFRSFILLILISFTGKAAKYMWITNFKMYFENNKLHLKLFDWTRSIEKKYRSFLSIILLVSETIFTLQYSEAIFFVGIGVFFIFPIWNYSLLTLHNLIIKAKAWTH